MSIASLSASFNMTSLQLDIAQSVAAPSLDVAHTLTQARQALQVHRKLMKRRVSPAPDDTVWTQGNKITENDQTLSVTNVWSNISSNENKRRERFTIGRSSRVAPLSNEVHVTPPKSESGTSPLQDPSSVRVSHPLHMSTPHNTMASVSHVSHQPSPCQPSHLEPQPPSHGMTKEELSEYQEFLKQLSSSKGGGVVTVAAAPKHKRTSYHKHSTSKLGTANISLTAEEEELELVAEEDSFEIKQNIEEQLPRATSSIVISVAPKASDPLVTGGAQPDDPAVATTSDIELLKSDLSIDQFIGPSEQTIDDPSGQSTGPPISSQCSVDLVLEEYTDTIEQPDAYIVKPDTVDTLSNTSAEESLILADISDELVTQDDGPVPITTVSSTLPPSVVSTSYTSADDDVAVLQNEQVKLAPSSMQEDGGRTGEEGMPLLRVKSTTSLYIPESTYKRKRERQPPNYSIHCAVPGPPCPQYNVVQPTDDEVLNTTVQAYKSIVNKTDPNVIDEPNSINNDIGTRPPVSVNNVRPSIGEIGDSQRGWSHDTNVATPSPVHEAARTGSLRYLNTLLKDQGCNVNGTDGLGYTPLMYCILDDNSIQISSANALIMCGANLDHRATDGSTVLHHASYVGALPLVELLLLSGANPDVGDSDGRLPLHWATNAKSLKLIQLLLKHSSNDVNVVDNSDMTPLMWACYNRNCAAAKCLVENGAEREEKDIDGKTAMHWAAQNSDIDCLKLLLTTDMTYFKDCQGCTVLHLAANSGFVKGVQHIMSLRPDAVHDTDRKGHTPLHYAAASDKVDVCYILLNKGADATQRDCEGHTPVDYGHMLNHEYTVALFTCHSTSMADFTRVLRSTSQSTLCSRAKSFSLGQDDEANFMNESISDTMLSCHTRSLYHDTKSLKSISVKDLSNNIDTSKYEELTTNGWYLGWFPESPSEPPLHYYFWIDHTSKTLYWSRSGNRHNKHHSRVGSVHEGPSNMVMSRHDYSPLDLHRFVFYVKIKDKMVSLLAYGEETYAVWIRALQAIATCASDPPVDARPQLTSTPLPVNKINSSAPLHPNEVI